MDNNLKIIVDSKVIVKHDKVNKTYQHFNEMI